MRRGRRRSRGRYDDAGAPESVSRVVSTLQRRYGVRMELEPSEFSPFGRDAPVTKLTPCDVGVVAGEAAPLKILVAVIIEE